MHVRMFLSAAALIFTFTVVGRAVSETYKKAGDKAVLSPGSVSGPITSVTWKHGADIAVEWYGQEKTEYRDFKGRCEVNTNTGALTISNLRVKDSGSYTAEISNKIMKTTEIKVITAVPKPTIKKQCNSEETQCTLSCDASITKDTGPVTYSWMIGDRQISPSSNWINITKDDTESVGKPISCQLENPVSSERSDDIMSPITNRSSVLWIIAPVVVIVLVIILVGVICWRKRRSGNADQSSGQCCTCFNRRNSLNFAERSRVTERSANGTVTGVGYHPVSTEDRQPVSTDINIEAAAIAENQKDPNQHQLQAEPPGTTKEAEMPNNTSERQTEVGPDQTPAEPTDPSSEAATSSENQEDQTQHQPEPEPTDTNNGAAASPDNQEDPNQHQPEAEPPGTNNGAEMPKNTSEHQTEVGPDQTPAESTDPSSEAATSSENQEDQTQHQPEPEPTDTNNGAAASPDNQEDPNQHQPEAEPPGTNNGAEMPKNTSEHQTEVGPDQTPAESTDPSSEAETSAEAPNVEEPPDHHHQQEDETTEE